MTDRTIQDVGGDGDVIRTFPFPVDLSVCGVGMQVGPMGTGHTWHADAPLHRVHRIDFHVVMLFSGGPVRHMIDFAEYEVGAGDVLWIRPGQVHRFSRFDEYHGTVLTMQPGFLPAPRSRRPASTATTSHPSCTPMSPASPPCAPPWPSSNASTRTPRPSRSPCTPRSYGTP